MSDDRGLFEALLGDGRFLLSLTGIALLVSGGFAILQSITGHFLPHDVQALGMDAAALARAGNPKIVHFMFHDRVAFGGALIAIGAAYWWLTEFPLSSGAAWSWWTLVLSGACGFSSFLAYLGYGYLDTWHGVATLLLLPVFLAGLWRARRLTEPSPLSSIWRRSRRAENRYSAIGRRLLLICGFGLLSAGLTIVVVGMTFVFVPQDLAFMGVTVDRLRDLSPVLIPLIAHDRAGFGGGVFNVGFLVLAVVWRGAPSRHQWQALTLAGAIGFGTAVGIHPIVGYNNPVHLAPACLGAIAYFVAVVLTRPKRRSP